MQLRRFMFGYLWFGQYELCGRQIFDLSENLVEMLNNTDLGETTLEGWNAPYDAFYIRFGKQEEISALFDETGVSEYVDGAFIGLTPATINFDSPRYKIKIAFTSVLSKGDPPLAPHHYIDFEPEELALPLERAVEVALERHASFYNQGDATQDGIRKYRVDAMKEEYDLLLKGCTLLVNSLFYLESIGAHNKTSLAVPGRDTPPSLVVEWENKKPAQRRKLASKLTRDGYALVHLTGQEFDGPSISRKDGAKRVHWVRGHWRNQAIGQGRLERKRIWIKPHVSGTKGTIDEAPGHLYAVSGPNPDIKH
jgi:hypothetical protein